MSELRTQAGSGSDERIQPIGSERVDPSLSVVVCAYSDARIALLTQCIDAITSQLTERDELIVVIDYNKGLFSTITTHNASGVRVMMNEDRKGLSGARNSGVRASTGTVVAFVDDDAEIQREWADRLRAHFVDPVVIGIGGYAQPVWPGDGRPYWFPIEYDWVVGCSHRGLPTEVVQVRNFIGCNMAFRRTVFESVGVFNTDMGRVGTLPIGCEETELCIRVSKSIPDARLLIDPRVTVRHWVSDDRTRLKYFIRRCFGEGVSKHRLSKMVGAGDSLSTERQYVTKVLPVAFFGGLLGGFTGRGGRLAGLARSFAIMAGLVVTTAGFAYSTLRSTPLGRAQ